MSAVARFDGREVVLAGRLDVHTVAEVRTALHSAIDAGEGRLTVYLHDAEVMDATGLGVLIGGHRRAERSGRSLVLRGPSPRLVRLLGAMRLHRVLTIEDAAGEFTGDEVPNLSV